MPSAPVQILPNGSGVTPAAPVQITANGSGSTPAVPVVMLPAVQVVAGVTVGGTLSPNAARFLPLFTVVSGKPWFANDGNFIVPATGLHIKVSHSGSRWVLSYYANGTTGGLTGSWQANTGSEATPDLATGWAPVSGGPTETGTPTFTISYPASPVQITANGSGSTPAAPVQITGNGSGATPASPVQIRANGGGSTPGNPPDLVPNGLAAGMIVGGTTSPDCSGLLIPAGIIAGKDSWSNSGDQEVGVANVLIQLAWSPEVYTQPCWVLSYLLQVPPYTADFWYGTGSELSPALCELWVNYAAFPGAGIPTVIPAVIGPSSPPVIVAAGSGATPAAPPAIV